MVEGPEVRLKCERFKVLETLKLLKFAIRKRKGEQMVVPEVNFSEQLQTVCCVGKELFLVFTNNIMMRFHFGMSGSERIINKGLSPPKLPAYSRKVMTSILYFDLKTLYLYDTTVTVNKYNPAEFTATLDMKLSRDVISLTFDSNAVVELLKRDSRPIMDGILDQHIMPGVGNIIKCEGLFLSHLNPNERAANISVDRLFELVQHLKDFSWRWYECSKRNLGDIYKAIYVHSMCSVCHSIVTLVRSGQTHRITYYCNHCQTMITSSIKTQSHSSTSLEVLGETIPPRWECHICSGHNVITATSCVICAGPAPLSSSLEKSKPQIPSSRSNQIINQQQFSSSQVQEPQQLTIQLHRCKCSHPATLNRVRKSGPTQNRLFWSCTQKPCDNKVKKERCCDFFHWADLRFPKCSQHSQGYTIMRRVLKAGPNNGRYFFSCFMDKCTFFVWESEFAKTLKAVNSDAGSTTAILTGKKRPFDEAYENNQYYVSIPL